MAKIPILESRVSPRVAADPGLRIPEQSRFLENVAQSADQLRARTTQIAAAEQEEKATSARIGLTTDLNQFMMDARGDDDPETLPDRFENYFSERLEHHASTLSPGIADTFRQRSQLASQDFQVKVGDIANAARSDRLLANTNRDMRRLVDGYATADSVDVREALAANGVSLLDDLLKNNIIDRVQHEKLVVGFADEALNAYAGRLLDRDPGALLDIDNIGEFSDMTATDRLKWKAAAERETERILREGEQKRKAEQRQYLATYDATVESMKRGAPLSASAIAMVSDAKLESTIDDPDLVQSLKAQRDIALAMSDDVASVPSMSPAEMLDRRTGIEAGLDATVSDTGDMAEFSLKQDRLANFDAVMTKVLREREKDPAGTAIRTTPPAQEAFLGFIDSPSPESFSAYKASLAQTYQDQGYRESSQRLFPVDVAKSQVAEINHIAKESPESAAQQIETLSLAMGGDWTRGLAELQSAGLDPLMGSVGLLTGNPGLQNQIVSIAQNGGVKALKEQIEKDVITAVDDEVSIAYAQAFRLADNNSGFMNSMADASKTAAYALVQQGYSESDAAELAVQAVLSSNFQAVEETRIRGLVDVEADIDPELLAYGSDEWFEANLGAVEKIPAPEGEYLVTEFKGAFYRVPLEEGENPITARHRAAMNQFAGLPKFKTREEADLPQETEVIPVSDIQAASFFIPGMREDDVQEVARRVLSNGGRFELSGDGKTATLVIGALGLPQAVLGPDGKPIEVSVKELQRLGSAKAEEIRRSKGMQGNKLQPDAEEITIR